MVARQRILRYLCDDKLENVKKMKKSAAITYWHMKGLQAQQIHKDMKKVITDNALSPATVYRWVAKLSGVDSQLKMNTASVALLKQALTKMLNLSKK